MKSKNQEGFATLEALMIFTILLPTILFICDLTIFFWKTAITAQTATAISRQVGIQGGVLRKAPSGYPGGDAGYINVSELQAFLKKKMEQSGFKDNEWQLKIGDKLYTASTASATKEYDYLEDIPILLTTTYKFPLLSNLLPGDLTVEMPSPRTTISEWKYNYDDWLGE